MNYLTGDEEVRRIAELREKWEMDYNSGIAEAKEEAKKIMVKKMKKNQLPIELIGKITGLTKEEIDKI